MKRSTDFIYVTRRLDGAMFCVEREYYNKYRDMFFLVKPDKKEEPVVEHIDLSEPVSSKRTTKTKKE